MTKAELEGIKDHITEACCPLGGCTNVDCPLPRDAERLLDALEGLQVEHDRLVSDTRARRLRVDEAVQALGVGVHELRLNGYLAAVDRMGPLVRRVERVRA